VTVVLSATRSCDEDGGGKYSTTSALSQKWVEYVLVSSNIRFPPKLKQNSIFSNFRISSVL
jgi:hypothetical protein